jgi:hypothetical protein
MPGGLHAGLGAAEPDNTGSFRELSGDPLAPLSTGPDSCDRRFSSAELRSVPRAVLAYRVVSR